MRVSRAQLPNHRQNGVVLQAAAATISNSFERTPQSSAAFPNTLLLWLSLKQWRRDHAVTGKTQAVLDQQSRPQAKDSATVEQLASLQCRLSLKGVAKKPVTDLAGKTQAVLPLSTVKRFLEANKLPYKEGHAALTLNFPLCERDTSQTVFINKTTGGLVCPPCKVHGEPIRLGPSGAVK